jgi:hypothetical protein
MLALIGVTMRAITQRRDAAQVHERQTLSKKPLVPSTAMVLPKPAPPVTPQSYVADTVERFLFARDRNPNVVVKVAPPPEPPVPPMPTAFGLMMFGDPTLFLSERPGAQQRGYRAGDQVGQFKLVAFNDQTVTLEWNGKTIEKSLQELVNNQGAAAAEPAAAAPANAGEPAKLKPVALVQTAPKQAEPGGQLSDTVRACAAGDSSPSGTVSSDGFRKTINDSPFGASCTWVKQ